jgi:hypothetical protein
LSWCTRSLSLLVKQNVCISLIIHRIRPDSLYLTTSISKRRKWCIETMAEEEKGSFWDPSYLLGSSCVPTNTLRNYIYCFNPHL